MSSSSESKQCFEEVCLSLGQMPVTYSRRWLSCNKCITKFQEGKSNFETYLWNKYYIAVLKYWHICNIWNKNNFFPFVVPCNMVGFVLIPSDSQQGHVRAGHTQHYSRSLPVDTQTMCLLLRGKDKEWEKNIWLHHKWQCQDQIYS